MIISDTKREHPAFYLEPEEIGEAQLEMLQIHANNMRKAIRNNKNEHLIDMRPKFRIELQRTVAFLYRYGINLTGHLQ